MARTVDVSLLSGCDFPLSVADLLHHFRSFDRAAPNGVQVQRTPGLRIRGFALDLLAADAGAAYRGDADGRSVQSFSPAGGKGEDTLAGGAGADTSVYAVGDATTRLPTSSVTPIGL